MIASLSKNVDLVVAHKGSRKVVNMGVNIGVNMGANIGVNMGVTMCVHMGVNMGLNMNVNMIVDLKPGRTQMFKLNLTLFQHLEKKLRDVLQRRRVFTFLLLDITHVIHNKIPCRNIQHLTCSAL